MPIRSIALRRAIPIMASAAFVVQAIAQQPLRSPVSDARPVMLAAIRSPGGEAHGVLSGDDANAITQRFGSTSPIWIDVATEFRFQQPGCSRLLVRFWQEGVLLPNATAPRKQTIEFGINYCLDGMPPKSPL